MRLLATALALGLLLAGCAEPVHETPRSQANDTIGGGIALAILGTPFYATVKAATCVLATTFAVPSSAAIALTDRPQREWQRAQLQEEVGRTCRGPYYLRPASG
jgi:hypothetical protein